MNKPKVHQKGWSQVEDVQLKNMLEQGRTASECANFFGRTLTAIYARKYNLGLEGRIKRSTKSQVAGSVKRWGVKPKRVPKTPQAPQVAAPTPPVAEIPKVAAPITRPAVKVLTQPKEKKISSLFEPYSYKLAFVNQRRRRGDVSYLAKVSKKSTGYVSSVLNGHYHHAEIMDYAFLMVEDRDANEKLLKPAGC